jgi:hypothetical protein
MVSPGKIFMSVFPKTKANKIGIIIPVIYVDLLVLLLSGNYLLTGPILPLKVIINYCNK